MTSFLLSLFPNLERLSDQAIEISDTDVGGTLAYI